MTLLTSSIFLWAIFLSCAIIASSVLAVRSTLVGVGLAILLMLGLYATSGSPRPVLKEWLQPLPNTEPVTVLAYTLREGVAIYVWLAYDEPLAVALPWSRDLAEELREASEEAGEDGRVELRWPSEPSLDNQEQMFHPRPQPALPPKPPADDQPLRFEQPA
jgi:hypothetical protein